MPREYPKPDAWPQPKEFEFYDGAILEYAVGLPLTPKMEEPRVLIKFKGWKGAWRVDAEGLIRTLQDALEYSGSHPRPRWSFEQLRSKPLADMYYAPITTRARNALKAAGIVTFGDLVKNRPERLLQIPGIGPTTVEGVKQMLDWLGLEFT